MQLRGTIERLSTFDLAVTGMVNRINQSRYCSRFFGLVSRLGDGVFWYALMGALLLIDGLRAALAVAHMIVIGLLATFIYKSIKQVSSRPRPYTREPRICLSTAPLDQFSFPSGHTLHAACFSCIAMHYYPALGGCLIAFALLVAISRLVLGLHYISDVLAGACIGCGLARLSLLV